MAERPALFGVPCAPGWSVLTAGAGAAGSQPVGFGLGLLVCGCGGAVSHRRNLGGVGEMADGASFVVTGHSSRRSTPPRWTPTGNGLQRGQFCWPPLGKTVGRQRAATWPPLGRISWPPTSKRSKRRPVGYTYLHVAIDDYSRVAYVEAHDNETAKTLVGFWKRAQSWFWSNDMPVDEVLTDNGPNFVSDAFADQLAERRIVHRRTRPYRPQTNGKAERFNRTLADEFLYNFKFRSESERRVRLKRWIRDYNCHRHHTAVGGPPASRANNLTRTDT